MTSFPPLACRRLIHGPAEGAWNMACDEALLESAAHDGVATLRLYEWSAATLSLGYFQAAADRRRHPASRACPLVRRASGGGAILHDRELTYSLAIPSDQPWARDARQLYFATHEALAAALGVLAVAAQLHRPPAPLPTTTTPAAEAPFLCFQRRAAGDLLIGDHKIAGSAQRRARGAILQHGSILLARSRGAPELPGIAELSDRQIDPRALGALLLTALGERLNLRWAGEGDEAVLAPRIETIAREKYAAAAWTRRR